MAHALLDPHDRPLAASGPLSRRRFLSVSTGLAAACALAASGCGSSQPSGDKGSEDGVDGAAPGPNESSATSAASFDPASFVVGDALGETYQKALEKAREKADDVVLFALRSSTTVQPGGPVVWDYMFASQKELRYYIAFTGTVVSVSELGKCTMKFAEWENVPAADAIKVDAAAAYESVCEAAVAAKMPQPAGLYAYLILYLEEADTAATEYEYVDEPMNWYFEFEMADDDSDDAAEGSPAKGVASDGDGTPITDGSNGASGEPENTSLVVYAVNAETGQTSCVVE